MTSVAAAVIVHPLVSRPVVFGVRPPDDGFIVLSLSSCLERCGSAVPLVQSVGCGHDSLVVTPSSSVVSVSLVSKRLVLLLVAVAVITAASHRHFTLLDVGIDRLSCWNNDCACLRRFGCNAALFDWFQVRSHQLSCNRDNGYVKTCLFF